MDSKFKCASVGDLIRSKGLSYAKLEDITHIPKSSLQRFGAGKTKRIDRTVVSEMARALDVDESYLLGEPDLITTLEHLSFNIDPVRNEYGSYVRITDDHDQRFCLDVPYISFDILARRNDFAAIWKAITDKKKSTPVSEDGLSDTKREFIEMVKGLSDDDVRRLRVIVDEVILRRGT